MSSLERIWIQDLTGRNLFSVTCENVYKMVVPLADVKKGIYLVSVAGIAGEYKVKKFIKG